LVDKYNVLNTKMTYFWFAAAVIYIFNCHQMISKPLLESHNICLSYDERAILKQINFSLKSGSCVAIVGKSGAGKSSLLKVLAGLKSPNSGLVMYKNQVLMDPNSQLIPGHKEIKLVNQDFDLDLFHTVLENLRIKLSGYVEKVKESLCEELLQVMDLKDFSNKQAQYLSGGEQQRLALARALIVEPDILLLDEPFVHIDPTLRVRIERYVKEKVAQWSGAIVIVTHDGREAMSWADEIVYIKAGEIKRVDTPNNFYWNPNTIEEAEHFGQINQLVLENKRIMFRPNAFSLVANDGVLAALKRSRFLGSHVENWFLTEDHQEIVLSSQEEMPQSICFKPHYERVQ